MLRSTLEGRALSCNTLMTDFSPPPPPVFEEAASENKSGARVALHLSLSGRGWVYGDQAAAQDLKREKTISSNMYKPPFSIVLHYPPKHPPTNPPSLPPSPPNYTAAVWDYSHWLRGAAPEQPAEKLNFLESHLRLHPPSVI